MQISEKIDQLNKNLQLLKPSLTENTTGDRNKFDSILKSSLEKPQLKNNAVGDYSTGKPNMRQLIEALSGETVEVLEHNSKTKLREYSKLASELLYGVIGTNLDSRDWSSIMASDDVIGSARKATGEMYQPLLDISNELDDNNNIIEQIVVIKEQSGNLLRSLNGSADEIEKSMINFGATKSSIPKNLLSKVIKDKIDNNTLSTLIKFSEQTPLDTLGALALKSHAAILNQNIPQTEIDKL